MPRRVIQPKRFLHLNDDLTIAAVRTERMQTKRIGSRKRRARSSCDLFARQMPEPPDLMARTRRLILAAVRVWELKRGLHEPL